MTEPRITYGSWSPTTYLRYVGDILEQRFRRKVKRDWGRGTVSKTQEYEWKPIPKVEL